MDKLRVGLVGTSWYADIALLPALQNQPRGQLTAICGRNLDRANEMAQKYSVPDVFTDYRALIDSGSIDALIVAAPDDMHHTIAMDAFDAGLHVLCEKPLAMNAVQAREMLEKAESARVKHMVMFSYQWTPHFHAARELVHSGYIGQCFQANFQYFGSYGRDGIPQNWRFDRQRAKGVLGDLGSHMIQLARWCLGEIVSVSGRLSTSMQRTNTEGQAVEAANDTAILMVEFASGALGQIFVSAVAWTDELGFPQQMNLYGDEGTLEVTANWTTSLVQGIRASEKAFTLLPVPDDPWGVMEQTTGGSLQGSEPLTQQAIGCRLFIDAVLDDRSATPNFYDGLKVQQVVDAALESHETGCRVFIR